MAILRINGRELIAKPIAKARNRDIIEMQRQSGMKMGELRKAVEEADNLGNVIVSFLAQHNAGFAVKWDELLDGSPEDLGELVLDEADIAQAAEANKAEESEDPPVPATVEDGDDRAGETSA